ncbi:MAG TPA: hypothetical protein ACFYED_11320 [Candidatus Tripitaka californicus]|uniref:hypothetical protein n=3 Tax=Candidatus Tripitaka californicus TaxID=3367616 RepID=UPI0040278BF1
MMVKKSVAIEGKKLLGLIILGSALVHVLVILFLPAGKSTRQYLSKALQTRESNTGSISLELVEVSPPAQEKQPLLPEGGQEALTEDLKKRLQFVDTGGSLADEEVKVETERVGEKGTLARDTIPGGSSDRPRLEGTSEAPSLGGSPGEAQGPSDTPEGESLQALVAEGTPQEEAQGVQGEGGASEGEGKGEEVAAGTPGPPQADTAQEVIPAPQDTSLSEAKEAAPEPLTQEPKLAEAEVEKPLREVKESESGRPEPPEGGKLASQTDKPETQAPIEDRHVPLLADAEKPAVGETNLTARDNPPQADNEEDPLEKELKKLEVREDGLIPIRKKEPKELAYVPPWELRGKAKEAARPKGRASTATPARGKPRVAMSFNAKSLSGGDIMPMMEAPEANAQGEGSPSFTVRKDEYAPYYRHIRDRISWYWYLGYATRQEMKLETEENKPIIIEFKVYSEGVVKEAKIVQEAGNHLLASRIKDSIEATHLDNFSRFGVKEEYIDVRFNFYFF